MFLFTTPPASTRETAPAPATAARSAGSAEVVAAIRDGAQSTGVGFDYLLATAQRESALDPSAKAGTSTATGLFQFIEQTWLGVMKNAGPNLGLGTYADAITARADGTYTVADGQARQAILDLRRDPKVAATLAGALTQKNREALGNALGREPTSGDLYAAHVLGARGAATLIGNAQTFPARSAALDLPEAAAANRSLFYDRTGRARSSSELYAVLASGPASAAAAAKAPAASDLTALPQGATAYASLDGGGLRSLFQTDRRQGAISEGVARLWQERGQERGGGSAERRAPTYFPRSDAGADTMIANNAPEVDSVIASAPAESAITGAITVPLPPRRPAEFSAQSAAPTAAKPRAKAPLDLSLFMIRSGP
ncbi:lytic transglycosylase domain-containing protein [Methylobacterium durans]|uniref:lytic transglycosylase domain-containing protein n=1 Tax=Methylobacterium durans TaxID=2202825 RepID=UPI002AFF7B6A|nr:lytic transglycosylase domain-containing protein [Methylobacterium durans]MEA1833575.1 lytic transglycosylase domain-containing protein [Methylobacterium durans]